MTLEYLSRNKPSTESKALTDGRSGVSLAREEKGLCQCMLIIRNYKFIGQKSLPLKTVTNKCSPVTWSKCYSSVVATCDNGVQWHIEYGVSVSG